ncbi:MAG: hypothetical protein H8E20_00150 [Verrucomicrobia bacterium]|nr:hypothetical protein [Verrucomicrobiota bacterium]
MKDNLGGVYAESAWAIRHDSDDVIVSIIDTGVDSNHFDLINQMWQNTFEANGVTGVDDDNNGFIDDILT